MDADAVKRAQALQVAVYVLSGDTGEYTEKDKSEAKLILMDMILKEEGRT